jgi:PPOX class probable F420-dependent enzyme
MEDAMGQTRDEDRLLGLLSSRSRGVLATIKRDGRPQLSNVDYTYDAGARLLRISITGDRAKAANLRRDPRASFHVTTDGGGAYAVAEATADLSAEAADPHDAVVEELIDVYRLIQGEHPDWDDYRAAMVADRRLVARLRVERVYGFAG